MRKMISSIHFLCILIHFLIILILTLWTSYTEPFIHRKSTMKVKFINFLIKSDLDQNELEIKGQWDE